MLHGDAAGGILLGLAAILAIIVANSPLQATYDLLLSTKLKISVGNFEIAESVLHWVNDGLMAIFFFLVGLELKRECIDGELREWRRAILPGIGALGGMIAPAIVYLAFNYDDPLNRSGWAIPAATDIAFALGVLSLLGPRVPTSLKVFLTSLAIFDDIGAILIIALFYTNEISVMALAVSAASLALLIFFNQRNLQAKVPYIMVGIVMWIALLNSGVHATLAGVLIAMTIPMSHTDRYTSGSMLKSFESDLHSSTVFVILPLFAFCNAGLSFSGIGLADMVHPVPMGIAAGLFLGKQLGVFGFCWAACKLKLTELPVGVTYRQLYGISALTGIGFTMSLFIGALAFEQNDSVQVFDERLGILLGSFASGVLGYRLLKNAFKPAKQQSEG